MLGGLVMLLLGSDKGIPLDPLVGLAPGDCHLPGCAGRSCCCCIAGRHCMLGEELEAGSPLPYKEELSSLAKI